MEKVEDEVKKDDAEVKDGEKPIEKGKEEKKDDECKQYLILISI